MTWEALIRFNPQLLFSQAFRPFFPAAALVSSVSVLIWLCGLSGFIPLAPYPTLWHAHEMLYGFATAVILGFVLTAAANWTGQQVTTPRSLSWLMGLWVVARLLGFWPSREGQMLSAMVDVLVLPVGAVCLARPLIANRNYRNIALIPLLFGLALINLGFHYSLLMAEAELARKLVHITVWLVATLMVFMGGRVIPFFSGRKLSYQPMQWKAMNWVSTLAALAVAICMAFNLMQGVAVLAGVAAFATGLRFLLWQPWRSVREPMLWILQFGYAWLIVAYIVLALGTWGLAGIPDTLPIHAVTAGALGCLAMGMMTRVALGHSGRPIQADACMNAVFVIVIAAGICRCAAYWDGPLHGLRGMTLSALLWSAAFGLYAVRFAWPLCVKPSNSAQA